ncbi:hypothetical protein [Sedimentitalea sp.]|uniref:hypothetical protein n=1 Tax=Sedimentitalea sp. TaxID=2048915 RepID=UPI00329A6DE1
MDRTIIGGSGYPDQLYVQLLKSLDLGTPDLDIDTVAGAELLYHQQNATSGWTDTADYEVITVTERADTYPFAMYNTYTGWINTFRNERQTSMDTWFSRSQTVGNGGAGCDFFYHTCWPGKEDYSGVGDTQDITPTSWRQKIGLDETEQLAIAERAEDNVAGDAKIWIIPGTRLMMQLYDDAEAGDMPDITDAADFMEDGNRWWADDIHQGPIMAMAYAYLFLYVIHGIDPRGLAYTGFDMPLEPTAAEASYIQNTVYNLVQSYPRAGVVA